MTSKRRSRSFWQTLMAEVDRGEGVAQVARRHRVNPRNLAWWRWRLRRDASAREPRLLPVMVGQAVRSRTPPLSTTSVEGEHRLAGVTVIVGEVQLRLDGGADIGTIAALVAALRATC